MIGHVQSAGRSFQSVRPTTSPGTIHHSGNGQPDERHEQEQAERRIEDVDVGLDDVRAGQLVRQVVHAGVEPALADLPVERVVGADRVLRGDVREEIGELQSEHHEEHAGQRERDDPTDVRRHGRTIHRTEGSGRLAATPAGSDPDATWTC